MVQLPVLLLEAQVVMQILVLPPQLADTLLLFSVEPSFPQNSGCKASMLTHGGPEGPVQQQ